MFQEDCLYVILVRIAHYRTLPRTRVLRKTNSMSSGDLLAFSVPSLLPSFLPKQLYFFSGFSTGLVYHFSMMPTTKNLVSTHCKTPTNQNINLRVLSSILITTNKRSHILDQNKLLNPVSLT